MKIYIYKGGQSLVAKSGVGSAIRHQEKMLRAAGVTVTDVWKEADIVQINTVLPDSPMVAQWARRQGKKVVYYGHSTMEDFKNSFIGSNLDSYERAIRGILFTEPREKVQRRTRAGRDLAEEHSMQATGEKLYQIEKNMCR